jgi:hypothetical protein
VDDHKQHREMKQHDGWATTLQKKGVLLVWFSHPILEDENIGEICETENG